MTDLPHVRLVSARPLGDKVLIKVVDPQVGKLATTVTIPFFMLRPEAARDAETPEEPDLQPSRGIIVAVGPGYVVQAAERFYVGLDVKVGDEVLFFEEKFLKVRINDEQLSLVPEQGILIVLDSLDGQPAVVLENPDGSPFED